ncbi:hypothetical protein GCM10027598_68150 [Amycolatopsis oliviviridis]|uniref:Uncharacterized protein n=1 Tax=Amycolatopsis oliviviridis TaxID=1471590 RepID=A0ABQ3M1Y2_9PSEU|nr:hypothetical protein GCM10017790_62560 [Amycolatopsis oliviviridis]
MCTLCPEARAAVALPFCTIEENAWSFAISQSTVYEASGIPPKPSGFSGAGASRVHSTTLSGSGSPEATPSWNGSRMAGAATKVLAFAHEGTVDDNAAAETAAAPPRRTARRFT